MKLQNIMSSRLTGSLISQEVIRLDFRDDAGKDKQIIIKPKLFSHGTQSVKPYTTELTCIMLEEKEVVKKEVVESKIL